MPGESQETPGSRPDPSVFTTEAIMRAVDAERDYVLGQLAVLRARLDGMDEAARVLSETVTRFPTDVQQEVGHFKELHRTQIEEMRRGLDERYDAQQRAVEKALEAAEKAVERRQDNLDREFHEHLEQVRHENALAFSNSEKAISAALAAQKEAVAKAETANEKRFESVNEFRGQLNDQAAQFLPRAEFDTAHNALIDKVESGQSRILERVGAMELRINGISSQHEGRRDQTATARSNLSAIVGLAGFILTVMIVATAVILAVNN